MTKFEKHFIRLNQIVVALLLAAIFIVVFVNVVMRYGFGFSLAWGEEVARFLMIAGTFFGAGLALREGRLVSIELMQDFFPKTIRVFLRWFLVLLMASFMVLLVWLGIRFAIFGWNKETMATQIPRGIPYLAIPVGAALFLLHLLFFARRYVNRDFEHDNSNDAEADEGPID